MKIKLNELVSIALQVPGIVKNVQKAFGKGQNEAKKAAAQEAASDVVALVNEAAKRDVLADAGVQALLSESIEIGVQMMKLEDRLRQIDDLIRAARVTPAA